MKTHYEVEMKFPIDDLTALENSLARLDAAPMTSVDQVDTYFAHPVRDFAVTDEAFRLRRIGEHNFVTYKGPKIDSTSKTRREIELPLNAGADYAMRFRDLLETLGFHVVADVVKVRRQTHVCWEGTEVEVVLDDVRDVGQYAELEIVAAAKQIAAANACLTSLAQELCLTRSERRSYLELLIGEDG